MLARIEGNRDMLALLRGEWSVYHTGQKRQINVQVIDFDTLDNNLFEITPEWEFTNGKEKNRYDLVFLINGIPILVAETKAAHKADGVNDGIKQIRRYHEETPEMMMALQMFDVTQLRDLSYGLTWNLERKNLFNWRDEQEGNYEAKIKAFCDRRRILKYVED